MSIPNSARTLASILTALALCWSAAAEEREKPKPPPGKPVDRPTLTLRLSGPYTHENLSIFLIHGEDPMKGRKFLTLDEALEQKKVIVHETQNVNELSITNLSDDEVFVQAGDIVKGGKQDRLLAIDLIVPAKSGKLPLAAFCVEHDRWGKRGGNPCSEEESEEEEEESFGSSKAQAPNKNLKIAARDARSQSGVWENVARTQSMLSKNVGANVKAARSASSLQLTLENKKLGEMVAAYEKALKDSIEGKDDVIGLAIVVNGAMNSAEVYASHELFVKLWPKLLRASAIETVTESQQGKKFDTPRLETVAAWLAEAEKGKQSIKDVNKRLAEVRQESAKTLLFETVDRELKGACLRRSYIAK
jgi:hypothetical protein